MYDTYADDIFRYLYVHVRDRELAEDMTAETFTRAWKGIEKFDFAQPRPWLYRIARNILTDYWRKKKDENMDENMEIVSDINITEEIDLRLNKKRVHGALNQLPEPMKSVVLLRFLFGYSAKETAASLKLSEGNVRIIQYRALKRLKELLA
jgi:RNA polymerase sigma-70 factor, ECF subfamily